MKINLKNFMVNTLNNNLSEIYIYNLSKIFVINERNKLMKYIHFKYQNDKHIFMNFLKIN
jgi:hypothetical protein